MKKRKWYGVALGVFALGGLIYAVVTKNSGKDDLQLYEAKFAFVAPKKWSKIAKGVLEADRECGTLTKCILYTQEEDSSQADALRYALLSGVDGIITAGMEQSPDTEAVILEAREAGIPVVYVDSDWKDSARNCYIGSDNYEVGRMAGELLAQKKGGHANVCVIVSYENNTNQQERQQGLLDAVEDYSDIQITSLVEGRSNALLLEKELPSVLKSHPEIDSIVCAEGASVHRSWKILEENGIRAEDYCIIGMDYYSDIIPQLENGVYAGMIWQNQYEMGYQAVKYLKDISDGKKRQESVLHTKIALVTAENFAEYTEHTENTEDTEHTGQEEIQWHVF